MRVHLAQISASKKAAAQEKVEIKLERDDHDEQEDGSYHLRESCVIQSNSGVASDEKIKHCESNVDFGDGDQSNSYELRENPKKSWRISPDPKLGLIKNPNSCKECGKEFASPRALSGHMRCHSSKNKKETHCCKECGRGFDSMRAMFGHMKSHSKRAKVSTAESAENLSDLENFCPIRRKRSRIRYKGTVNPSFSGVDASNSAVSELEEAEEAAKSLMMLSKGVGSFLKPDSVTVSSDDDSAYFGAVATCRSKKFCGIDGDFVSDAEKKLWKLPQLECCSSGNANAATAKNVSEFDELDLQFVAGDQTKLDPEVADELLRDENRMKVDFVPSVDDDTLLEHEQSDELAVTLESANDLGSFCPTKSKELDKDLLVAIGDESGYENEEVMEDSEKKPEHKHRACYKIIHSQRALGSRIARHRMQLSSSNHASLLSVNGDDQLEQESGGVGPLSLESSRGKERECPICFKVFPSGQALGGHKRAHYNGVAESKNREAMAAEAEEMLDLNFPITVDAGNKTRLGLSSWFVDRSREHEALVLTT